MLIELTRRLKALHLYGMAAELTEWVRSAPANPRRRKSGCNAWSKQKV